MPSATTSFAADRMLGRLATWLRLLGFDTTWDPRLDGWSLALRAAAEGRVLLTRDTRLLRRRGLPAHLFIPADDFRSQLRHVVDALGIDPRSKLLTRCSRCNEPLESLPAAEARDRVPKYVAETQRAFARCPSCGRIYWHATHVERLMKEIERIEAPRE